MQRLFTLFVPNFVGMGDMAISNCLGSNIFDILLGLSLPWFLKTGIAYAGTTVSNKVILQFENGVLREF